MDSLQLGQLQLGGCMFELSRPPKSALDCGNSHILHIGPLYVEWSPPWQFNASILTLFLSIIIQVHHLIIETVHGTQWFWSKPTRHYLDRNTTSKHHNTYVLAFYLTFSLTCYLTIWHLAFAVEVPQCPLRSGARESEVQVEEGGGQHGQHASLIKSRDPGRWGTILVGGWATPLKNMSSSVGMMTFPIYGNIENGNQTTNQYRLVDFPK